MVNAIKDHEGFLAQFRLISADFERKNLAEKKINYNVGAHIWLELIIILLKEYGVQNLYFFACI